MFEDLRKNIVAVSEPGKGLETIAQGLQVLLDRYPDDTHITFAMVASRETVEILIGLLTPVKH